MISGTSFGRGEGEKGGKGRREGRSQSWSWEPFDVVVKGEDLPLDVIAFM